MKINNSVNNSVNFTSVVPVKVFIDGRPSANPVNIRRAVRGLEHILTNPANGEQSLIAIKKDFVSHDRDFNYFGEKMASGMLIRNIVDKGVAYLFTGEHAKILNELGKKIGPEKSRGLEYLGTTKTFESNVLAKKYFERIQTFLSYPKIRIRESISLQTRMYIGDEVELHINAKSVKDLGKKGFGLNLENISFKKLGSNEPEPMPEVNREPKANVVKNAKPIVKKNMPAAQNNASAQKTANSQTRINFDENA